MVQEAKVTFLLTTDTLRQFYYELLSQRILKTKLLVMNFLIQSVVIFLCIALYQVLTIQNIILIFGVAFIILFQVFLWPLIIKNGILNLIQTKIAENITEIKGGYSWLGEGKITYEKNNNIELLELNSAKEVFKGSEAFGILVNSKWYIFPLDIYKDIYEEK